MKKQNGFSMIFIIPVIALALAIGGVFAYKLYSEGTRAKASETPKTIPSLQGVKGKPSAGYGSVSGPTLKISPTPGQTDLETIINETDDGGESDLKEIETSAAQL